MDWKQILSLSFDELTDLKRDEIYESLVNLKREQLDRKHHKKLIDLMQHILKYKGDMVNTLLTELEGISTKDMPHINADILLEENTSLKQIIDNLEADKLKLKQRNKELSEEIVLLQRRHTDNSTIGSDREDSPNLLSELDKQEELLIQISQKNKHIKRLLRDIETLENESSQSRHQVQLLEVSLKEATHNVSICTSQLEGYKAMLSEKDEVIEGLNLSVRNLSDQMGVMEAERAEREVDIQVFGARLEERAMRWRQLLQDKDDRLDSLRTKYENVLEQNPGYDIDSDREGLKRMAEAVSARDHYIADLEDKIADLSREMTDTTELLNRLAKERETVTISDQNKSICPFCNDMKTKSDALSARCASLQEIVCNLEEETVLKSKEALDAQKALASFKLGEDGLAQALARNVELQSKIDSRDKQIRSLIIELNILQTCSNENEVLRQRLGISDDEVISTAAITSKHRKQEKMNKRLALKLRASEEIRLQLKLDKHDLRQQLAKLSKTTQCTTETDSNPLDNDQNDDDSPTDTDQLEPVPKKATQESNRNDQPNLEELELRYTIIVEENENLRVGMHEILEQLRNYDAQADHIVIDTPTLEKLLHALDARSISGWYHPAMRMQNELIAAREREVALIERIRISEDKRTEVTQPTDTKDMTQIQTESEPIATTTHLSERKLDNILQHITDQEVEISTLRSELERIQNQYRESVLLCDHLKNVETLNEDLSQLLANNDNEQFAILSAKCRDLVDIQNKCNREVKKNKFIQEDYEYLGRLHKSDNASKNRLIFELRKKLLELENGTAKTSANAIAGVDQTSDDLKQELVSLKATISRLSASALSAFVNFNDIDNITMPVLDNIGIIQADYTLQFIAKQEFDGLCQKCSQLSSQNAEMKAKIIYLEELVELSQNQLAAEQRINNQQNEEAIATKHLVVDLQSESQEKYIIAKLARDLKRAVETEEQLKGNIHELQSELNKREKTINEQRQQISQINDEYEQSQFQSDIKIKFLSKSYSDMRQQFHPIAPLYPVLDFMKDYAELLQSRRELRDASLVDEEGTSEQTIRAISERVQKTLGQSNLEDKLLIIKYESHQAYLEEKCKRITNYLATVHQELDQLKLRSADWSQHWLTIELLFGENKPTPTDLVQSSSKETQANISTADKCINTDPYELDLDATHDPPEEQTIPTAAPRRVLSKPEPQNHENLSLASQLKQAMYLASARSALLLEHESRLAVAHARVKTLEKIFEERDKTISDKVNETRKSPENEEHILSGTIASMQNLLHDKDSTLLKYQEMLQTERQNAKTAYDEQCTKIKDLQAKFEELQEGMRGKDNELVQLKSSISLTDSEASKETVIENQSMPDTMLEVMFLEDRSDQFDIFNSSSELSQLQKRLQDAEEDARMLRNKLREVSLRESGWERTMCEKDNEISELNERINQMDTHDVDTGTNRRDIEQLREMLEEKDRHINDLTETLTHFHDDQQKFMNDTTLHSAEQVSQLSVDLNRYETTNRILNTQLDALKRQLASVGQRESQARDVIKTLKTQLIRRPVISLKATDRNSTNREEQLQKRVHHLDNELQVTREELRKQTAAAQFKRSKDAAELALWSKQKRFQQIADTLKQRLVERENELDKVRGHLNTSKTAIARLEREKNMLNDRLSRSNVQQRYCNHPSCPSVHLSSKRAAAESPDSYATSNQNECLHGAHSAHMSIPDSSRSRHTSNQLDIGDNNQDIVEAQRVRIEAQQRKIVAMELEGRGSSSMSHEIERLQEKLSAIEAQNIRLEAKNLHLQLNNDMISQSDQSEKDKRQIKHLEDYVIALKSELVQTQNKAISVENRSSSGSSVVHNQQLEQTILAMRRVLDRLKAENKILKDSKMQPNKEEYEKLRIDFGKVQHTYSEALDKISALQIELEIQTGQCVHCKNRIMKSDETKSDQRNTGEMGSVEWGDMKDKLIKKTQLLEKAKILLSRAAAKERQFREQIAHWKRRCSELQNVPVIEEEPTH